MEGFQRLTLAPLVCALFFIHAAAVADTVRMRVPNQGTPQAQQVQHPQAAPRGAAVVNRLPDLTIIRFSASPMHIRAGEMTTLTAMVGNNGPAALPNVSVRFIQSKTGRILGEDRIAIGAGQSKTATITVPIAGTGPVTVEAVVDPQSCIKEADEKNNRAQSVVTVMAAIAAPAGNTALRKPQIPATVPGTVKGKVLLPKAVPQSGQDGGPQAPPGGNAWGYDYSCSVYLENGVYQVNALNPSIQAKIYNHQLQNAPAFDVGLGRKGSSHVGNGSTWMSVFRVPAGSIPQGKWTYVRLNLPPSIDEKTDLIVAVDIKGEVRENDETNNFSEPFRVKYFKPEVPPKTADLMVFPQITDGIYYGDGKGVVVRVQNNGRSDAPPSTIGIALYNQLKKGANIKWVGKAAVPKIFSQQHVYVTIPGQFQSLPAETLYGVAADIDGHVDEQGREDNNLSKPFTYHHSSKTQATLPPKGNPFEAFDILEPKAGAKLPVGSELTVRWYPTQALNSSPPETQSSYWEIDMDLVDPATGNVVAKLAQKTANRPVNGLHTWTVTLPDMAGDYRLRFSSPLGGGWGQSGVFSLYKGAIAQAAVSAPDMAKGPQAITSQKVEKSNLSLAEVEAEALQFKLWRIKSITPKTVALNGTLGPYARLASITVVVEYESNKPFRFAPSLTPPDNLKPDAVWSLAVPQIHVAGGLADKSTIDQIHGSHSSLSGGFVDPTGSYPWKSDYQIGGGPYPLHYPKGILPKGRNTFTLVLDEAGLAHGIEVVGKVLQWETSLQGVVKKKKSYYAKCTRSFYPHFSIQVRIGVYQGGWSSAGSSYSDTMTYGFKSPPAWQHLDPWETTYFGKDQTSIGIPTFSAGDCQ